MDSWSKDQTVLLITELKKHPTLYNPLNKNFTNKKKRNEAYESIEKELKNIKKEISVKNIKKKIRTLQSQLSRERKRKRNFKSSDTEDIYEPKLWCYELLSSLSNVSDTVSSTSNLDLPQFLIEVEQSEESEEIIKAQSLEIEKIELAEETEDEEIVREQSKKYQNELTSRNNQGFNNFDRAGFPFDKETSKEKQFCALLCTMLKKFKLDNSFNELTVEILQLVTDKYKAEEQELKNL